MEEKDKTQETPFEKLAAAFRKAKHPHAPAHFNDAMESLATAVEPKAEDEKEHK